ncbi:zinc-binding dehydrogenase domain-containing protein [Ditylenchus destructor]|nr:zinc-binding dehydrogenase domain-containing protein [Ditylenchus destructor]
MLIKSARLICTKLPSSTHSRAFISTKRLVYKEYGDPLQIMKIETHEVDPISIQPNEVFVRWIAAPINPADINQLQGVYPVKPSLPAVGGNEGCARVEKVGSNVNNLNVGDLVIPARSGLGTWSTHGLYECGNVFPIDKDLSPVDAATLQVNPSTAYRMLKDFVSLNPGSIVVQNGANSAVGRYVIQICRNLKLKSINVVRDRDNIQDLKNELISLGAGEVYTEEEFAKVSKTLSAVNLALNCVGGRSCLNLARVLAPGGCLVTYGGMSKQPVQVSTASLIFNNITLKGFWMSKWYDEKENIEERNEMYKTLSDWIKSGSLHSPPVKKWQIEEYLEAIPAAMSSSGMKQIFALD